MLLAIDIGNTQTVIGMFSPTNSSGAAPELLHHWRISTDGERTADDMAVLMAQLLDLQGFDIDRGTGSQFDVEVLGHRFVAGGKGQPEADLWSG